jgi:hypothetical protein
VDERASVCLHAPLVLFNNMRPLAPVLDFDLFNDAVNRSDYLASNFRICNEYRIGNEVNGSGLYNVYATFPTFERRV